MDIVESGKNNLKLLVSEIDNLEKSINDAFVQCVKEIYGCEGRIIFSGVGKTGIIARKLAATFSSTGTYSIFMQASEGLHGDLGMIHKSDIFIPISNSGTSQEILNLLPSIKEIGAKIISLTGNIESTLGQNSDIVINTHVNKELCPLNLAPTTSTTAALVMGDLIAIEVMKLRNFKIENFALYHPGGAIGRRLLQKVRDMMSADVPTIDINGSFSDLLYTISSKRLGVVCVMENDKIIGIITDGDIRRKMEKEKENIFKCQLKDIMTSKFTYANPEELAFNVLSKMKDKKISVLPIIEDDALIGVINIHDLHEFN